MLKCQTSKENISLLLIITNLPVHNWSKDKKKKELVNKSDIYNLAQEDSDLHKKLKTSATKAELKAE